MGYYEGFGSIRTKKAPKKTIKAYKLMRLVDGKLYPLFIDSSVPTEIGVWYDADSTSLDSLRDKEAGFYYLMSNEGDVIRKQAKKPTKTEVEDVTKIGLRYMYVKQAESKQRRYGGYKQYYNVGINGSGVVSPTYAIRPGWHAGSLPTMRQIGKGSNKDKRDDSFVWTEVELSADVDYNPEAQRNPDKDIPDHIPEDGYYMKATNADKKKSQADLVGWYVAGAMKINRIISDKEARQIIDRFNAKHPGQKKVEYDYDRESGKEFEAGKMMLEGISSVLSGLGMSVHHNSPYLLKRADGSFIDPETGERLGFDHRFMSSGEGHQAHGWGSYFSVEDLKKYGENKSVKKDVYYVKYKGILYSDKDKVGEKYVIAYDLIQKEGTTSKAKSEAKRFKDKAVDNEVESFWDDVIGILSNSKKSDFKKAEGGHHYHVEIPDNDGIIYLEEDKPITDIQAKMILKQLKKELKKTPDYFSRDNFYYLYKNWKDKPIGKFVYADLKTELKSFENASKFLHRAGFVGIHYYGNQDGECYVIFNENDAKIVGHDLFGVEDTKREGEVFGELEGLGSRLYGGVEQPSANTYRMLGRLKSDCDYYLGHGNRYAGHLYHHNEVLQIKDMIEIWDSLPDDKKPEWLTIDQLEKYSVELTGKTIEEFKNEYMSDDISEAEKEKLRSYKGKGGQKNTTDRGILDEFYTPEYVCEFMYQLAVKYGYKCGKVLEPSIAIGNCIRPIYERNDYTHIDAFEINETSREICKKLYPNVTIYPNYFETAFLEPPRFSTKAKKTWLPNAPYDLAIGNPPYGKHINRYSSYFTGKDKFAQTEMFFIYESLKLLRPGGLLVFITSTNFMSTGNAYQQAKERIEEIADLVDAYRLPKVFDKTDICTDIIVLRKK